MVESVQAQSVWHYDDWNRWCAEFDPWLDARFHRDVLRRFTENAHPTWLEWLDAEQSTFTGSECSVSLFRKTLVQRFQSIRLYHATRLSGLKELHKQGLRAWSPDELRHLARQTFSVPGMEPKRLTQAIEDALPDHRGGRVYTFRMLQGALDRGRCSGFSKHGSEFLGAVARNLGHAGYLNDVQDRKRGYLIACDVPWNVLESEVADWLARDALLTVVVYRFFYRGPYRMPMCDGECIPVSVSIPVSNIAAVADVESLLDRTDVTPHMLDWNAFSAAVSSG